MKEFNGESFLHNTDKQEIVEIDGKKYKKVDSGYTLRQYFSHSTPEKGPGPGWDSRHSKLEKLGFDPTLDPKNLPDEPYYFFEQVD